MHSSNTLIHPSTTVYDFNYTVADKHELLLRVQYWKDYFKEHNIKSINLLCYQGITQTAIMLACLEESITINLTDHESCTLNADLAIIGFYKKQYHDKTNPRSLLIADNIQVMYKGNDYIESEIDTNFRFIVNGDMHYTAGEFIGAAQVGVKLFSLGQNIATIQHMINVDTSAIWLLSPVMAGTNIYACAHIIDLGSLLYRGLIDQIGLYPMHLSALYCSEDGANSSSPFGTNSFAYELNQVEIMTTGNLPSVDVLDWLFARGASKIKSIVMHRLTPLFYNSYSSGKSDFFSRELEYPLVEHSVNNQNELLFKYIDNQDSLWHNTKIHVEIDNSKVILKGTEKINNTYANDVRDFILGFLMDTKIGPVDFALQGNDEFLKVVSFTQYTNNKFNELANKLSEELKHFCGIEQVAYEYVDKSKTFKI